MAQSKKSGAATPEMKTDQASPGTDNAAAASVPANGGAATAGPKAGPVMYLGPNLPGGVIMHGQVFRGGLPPMIAELAGDMPVINDLMVAVGDLPEAKQYLKDPTTPLAKAYRAAAAAPVTTRKGD